MPTYDAVVVGAGPAGLSAAAAISDAGGRCLLVEMGRAQHDRDRDAPDEILSGVGGAGLFSDGKHSFHPAATALWQLPDRALLEAAYEATCKVLPIASPPFPALDEVPVVEAVRGWTVKPYPSIYAPLDARRRCIAALLARCREPPWVGARVVSASRDSGAIALDVARGDTRIVVRTRRLVVATGRLSPRWIRGWLEPLGARFAFRRLDIGVRIETPSTSALFATLAGVDPKLSVTGADGSRILTFCTCRDGEVVRGASHGIVAVSGRADGPKTGRSSVGVLVRISDASLGRALASDLATREAWTVLLADVTPALEASFGECGAPIVANAITRFVETFHVDADARVHGPCLEGVGDYPESTDDLEIAPGVLVAGDVCGRFRGIVASLVSGRYAGTRATS